MERSRGSIHITLLMLFFGIMTGAVVAAFCLRGWLPRVASEHGPSIDGMIRYLLIATGGVFVVGHAVLIAFLWRYREGSSEGYRPVNPKKEWLWALVPVLIMTMISEGGVLLIGLPVWAKVYGEPPKDALVIEVVGKQFEWLVRYPGADGKFGRVSPHLVHATENPLGLDPSDPSARDDIVLRSLTIPSGRHVVIRLRSHDVLHSFCIPEFRVKQDVVPGFTATTQFTATIPGTYEIACVELCGLGHFRMRSVVTVKTPDQFEKWLRSQVGWFEE